MLAFKLAERNYIASSEVMSQRLADSFINFDLVSIVIGLLCLSTVSYHFIALPFNIRLQRTLLKCPKLLISGTSLHNLVICIEQRSQKCLI